MGFGNVWAYEGLVATGTAKNVRFLSLNGLGQYSAKRGKIVARTNKHTSFSQKVTKNEKRLKADAEMQGKKYGYFSQNGLLNIVGNRS